MGPYSNAIEESMKGYYSLLSERDKRLYAAVEAKKLGYGGKNYISKLLGCSRKTITRGTQELEYLSGSTQ